MSVDFDKLAALAETMAAPADDDAATDGGQAVMDDHVAKLAALPRPTYTPPAPVTAEQLYGPLPTVRTPVPAKPTKPSKGERPAKRSPSTTLTAFVDSSMRCLKPSEVAVWLTLYRDGRDHDTTRTAQTSIAARTNLSASTVKRAVVRLRALGLVRVVYQGGFPKRVSRYTVRGAVKPGRR